MDRWRLNGRDSNASPIGSGIGVGAGTGLSSFGSLSSGRSTRRGLAKTPPTAWADVPTWTDTYAQMKRAAEEERPSDADAHSATRSADSTLSAAAADDADVEFLRVLESSNAAVQPAAAAAADEPEEKVVELTTSEDAATDSPRAALDGAEGPAADEDDPDAHLSALEWSEKHVRYAVRPDLNAKIKLYQGDITKLKVDAVVNAANSGMWAGGGICGAIFDAATEFKLANECKALVREFGRCPTGAARVTRGYNLPARFIIHTVGPQDGDPKLLAKAYRSTYEAALAPTLLRPKESEKGARIRTLAVCCISTGIYGFENDDAAFTALDTTRKWLEIDPARAAMLDGIVFCTFLRKDQKIYEQLLPYFFPVEPRADGTTPPTPTPAVTAHNGSRLPPDPAVSSPSATASQMPSSPAHKRKSEHPLEESTPTSPPRRSAVERAVLAAHETEAAQPAVEEARKKARR